MKKKLTLFAAALIVSLASFAVVIHTSCGISIESANEDFESVEEMVDMAMYLDYYLCR